MMLSEYNRANDALNDTPRLRMSLSGGPVVLTATWVRLAWAVSGAYDVNSFPALTYDATNKLIKTNATASRNYDVEIFTAFTAALGILPLDLQLRFVVPSPTPIYFPFPSGAGYTDLHRMSRTPANPPPFKQILYFESAIRQYGFGIEMRAPGILSALNAPSLTDGALSIFPR